MGWELVELVLQPGWIQYPFDVSSGNVTAEIIQREGRPILLPQRFPATGSWEINHQKNAQEQGKTLFEQIFDHLGFLAVVLIASRVFPELDMCPGAWWRWLPPCFCALGLGGNGHVTYPRAPAPPTKPTAEARAAQCTRSFPLQHAAPLWFMHTGSISQGHPSTVHMLNTSYSVPSSSFNLFPRIRLPVWKTKSSAVPSPNYFVVELHVSFIETLITSKLSLCCVKYVGCKPLRTLSMRGGENGGMDRAQDEAAPSSWPSAFAPMVLMWAWSMWGLPLTPSRPPQWGQKDVLAVYYLDEGWGRKRLL